MEPQLPKPQIGPERAPMSQPQAQNAERFVVPKSKEQMPVVEQSGETKETFRDDPTDDPVVVQQQLTPPSLPVVPQDQPTSTTQVQGMTTPAVASDDDLIEKEWVEKAKRVVAETRNDPHAQDIAIGKLQADYLQKRYGKVIALPKEE